MTWTKISDLFQTTKPRILLLVLLSTLVGFLLAGENPPFWLMISTLAGTALVCASCNSLNQFLERDVDGKMQRTRKRPLPAGRLSPGEVLKFGCLLGIAGLLCLALAVNFLTALVGAAALGMYLFVYTPAKRITPLCTLIGAVPGAAPVLMGWAAVRNSAEVGGWILFAIVFLWQLPHFFAIATVYREEYAAAGLPMLPVKDMASTNRQIVGYSFGLLLVSLLPFVIGLTGSVYFYSALSLGLIFVSMGVCLLMEKFNISSRMIFFGSIIYLPLLLTLMVMDKT